jgi:hypothetical protein
MRENTILKQKMLQQEILKRELPPLLTMNDGRQCTAELWGERRAEILNLLRKNIYGYTPEPPEKVTGEIVEQSPERALSSSALPTQICLGAIAARTKC